MEVPEAEGALGFPTWTKASVRQICTLMSKSQDSLRSSTANSRLKADDANDESQYKSRPSALIDETSNHRTEANPENAKHQRRISQEYGEKIVEASENFRTNSDDILEKDKTIRVSVMIEGANENTKSSVPGKRKKRTVVKSDAEYSLPRNAKHQRRISQEYGEKIVEASENFRTNSDDVLEKDKTIRVSVVIEGANENTKSSVPWKRKKRTIVKSDSEYALPMSRKKTKKEKEVKEELVGSRVKVWWPLDQQYYEGMVASYDPAQKKHEVMYFDGEIEFLILENEVWIRVDQTSNSEQDQVLPSASAMPPADESEIKRKRNKESRIKNTKTQQGIKDQAMADDVNAKVSGVMVHDHVYMENPDYAGHQCSISEQFDEKFVEADKDKRIRVSVIIEGVNEETQTNSSSDDEAYISDVEREKGEYVGVEEDDELDDSSDHDGLDDMWALLNSSYKSDCKDPFGDIKYANPSGDGKCDHSVGSTNLIYKDDTGWVCRLCGMITEAVASIIDYQSGKTKRSERTYSRYERAFEKRSNQTNMVPDGTQLDEISDEVFVHPRHQKVMKDHQFEGFRFLSSNLMAENPGGCVMAHAPGSGKTFMIISFLQIFMTKYISARPLIVLPRGILSTWKKEFEKWQVEDMPLYDFYSAKADNRSQQLEVLQKWGSERSILFLSYRQFTVIVSEAEMNDTTRSCRKFLLDTPSVLILDEGHTPRNDDTDILTSLQKVKTPRKVVLSGTLYQNHVKEVFNVLSLVRPKFLKADEAKAIQTRIMSKVGKRSSWTDAAFYDAVERTFLDDLKFGKKVHIVKDLREMTSKVLHYYKGDSLDELPGLVDFTVFLELSETQKEAIQVLEKSKNKFRIFSEGSAIYVHPRLHSVIKQSGGNSRIGADTIDDQLLENMSEVGAKAKFYFNLLELCESRGEKLLVFSQYIGPLKFLERLTVKLKKYSVGRQMFVITGDSDAEIRDSSMEQFNKSSESRVFFGSIKACGEGISLVGASRIIILDVHPNPSVTRQAIGRAFRPGQKRKVYTYRLVASGSPEEKDHLTCFRKECIAKLWFECNEYQGLDEFDMETVDVNNCGDMFLESDPLKADVVSVCKR